MKAIDFMPGQTLNLGEDQEEFFTLPAIRLVYSDGNAAFISAWVANFRERVRILFGKPVYLTVLTNTPHPPVLLSLYREDIGIDEYESLHKEKK
jgi:hypothetical protein